MVTVNTNTSQSFCMYLKKYCLNNNANEKFIWCFRGHKSIDFEYVPSILRKQNEYLLKHEDIIKKETISRYPDKFNSFEKITPEDIALMQHYGLPTRFLDITFNPFVALFFASESVNKSEKISLTGEVAVLKIPKDIVVYSSEYSSNKNKLCLVKTALDNPRIKSQNGAFLTFGDTGENNQIPEDWFVLKIRIQNSKKKALRDELAIMNITESTLFPELENFQSEIKRKYGKDK